MATFLLFGSYSDESIHQISPKRTDKTEALLKQNGGKLKGGYALLGEYDLILVVELPDIEQAIKTSVALSKMTGIAFTTAPAVTIEEFDKITEDL